MRSEVTKEDYKAFHASTGADTRATVLEERTDREPGSLSPFERKQEFYGLLKNIATPGIISHVDTYRRDFYLGLVEREGASVRSTFDTLNSELALDRSLRNIRGVSDALYRAMRRTLETAATAWENHMIEQEDPDFRRLEQLMEPVTQKKYGAHALSKRVASATAQTVSVGLGLQDLAMRLFRKKFGTDIGKDALVRAHESGLRIAMVWADFNRHELVALESKIRTLRTDHEGIEHLHAEDCFDIADDGTLVFTGGAVLAEIATQPLPTAEGRFGCPGKKHIPHLWQWTQEVSSAEGPIAWAQ